MPQLDYGPVEFVLVQLSADRPTDELVQALRQLAEAGTIRLLDLVFVKHDDAGQIEITDVEDGAGPDSFSDLQLQALGLASEEDIATLARMLEPGTSAAVLALEMLWAKDLASKLADAGGFVAHAERIPAPVVNAALADLPAEEQE